MMYYYLNENNEIIGVGRVTHSAYKSVSAGIIDSFGVDDVMGYVFKDGRLTQGDELKKRDEFMAMRAYKDQRAKKIAGLVVTTASGKNFDADEDSQQRMLIAFETARITGASSTIWKLADDSRQEVTLDELKEALVKAATKMSEIFTGESGGDK